MNPTVIMGTGENLGAFTVNVDQGQMMHDLFDSLRKIFGTNGNRRKLLIVFAVIFFIGRLKARSRRKAWENEERERARIWKEEYKG